MARTDQQTRDEALSFFERVSLWPAAIGIEACDVDAFQNVARQLLEASLALAPGENLDVKGVVADNTEARSNLRHALRLLPYFCGHLGLLEQYIWHEQAGEVPPDVVLQVLKETSVMWNGHPLTSNVLFFCYRRQRLEGEAAASSV